MMNSCFEVFLNIQAGQTDDLDVLFAPMAALQPADAAVNNRTNLILFCLAAA